MQTLNKDQIRDMIKTRYFQQVNREVSKETVEMVLSSLLHFYPADQEAFTYEELFIGALQGL